MKTVKDFAFKGKRVLVRSDFNVPVAKNGAILDDFRIKSSLLTIKYLVKNQAKIILMSHLGDPGGKVVGTLRLDKIQERLFEYLDLSITKAKDSVGQGIENWTKNMEPGEILLLENLRFHPEEEKGDLGFSKKLARLGDIFLNDAFACSHRNHASFKAAKYLPCGSGLLLEKELSFLIRLRDNPSKPLVVILGGKAKGIETKIKLIKKMLLKAEFVLLGNLIANELKKRRSDLLCSEKMIVPLDSVGGLDIGPKTLTVFKEKIFKARTVFWSGPLGKIEEKKFSEGSLEIAKAIIKSGAFSVAGGGETTWFLDKLHLAEKFNHISTGGDALLMFLSGEKLPAIEILN